MIIHIYIKKKNKYSDFSDGKVTVIGGSLVQKMKLNIYIKFHTDNI